MLVTIITYNPIINILENMILKEENKQKYLFYFILVFSIVKIKCNLFTLCEKPNQLNVNVLLTSISDDVSIHFYETDVILMYLYIY